MLLNVLKSDGKHILNVNVFQDLYCVRSDLGNLLKALGRLEEAKVRQNRPRFVQMHFVFLLQRFF